MRRLVLRMAMSLDGFVAGPGGEMEWLFRSRGDDSTAWIVETLREAGLHAMGSRTYRVMASHWPTATGPFAAPMNDIPKVVFTRQPAFDVRAGGAGAAVPDADRTPAGAPDREATGDAGGWGSARVANGDLADEVRRLKLEPGGAIVAHGGAAFARSLTRLGLVDEYRLLILPVALGSGLPLFADLGAPADLNLMSTSVFRSGAVAHVYRPAGT